MGEQEGKKNTNAKPTFFSRAGGCDCACGATSEQRFLRRALPRLSLRMLSMALTRRRSPSATLTDALKLLRRNSVCSLGRSDISDGERTPMFSALVEKTLSARRWRRRLGWKKKRTTRGLVEVSAIGVGPRV